VNSLQTVSVLNFTPLLDLQGLISFQLPGDFALDLLTRDSAPWIPLGQILLDPRYRLSLTALAMHSTVPRHFSKAPAAPAAEALKFFRRFTMAAQ